MSKVFLGLGAGVILLLSGCDGMRTTHNVEAVNDSVSMAVGGTIEIEVLANDRATNNDGADSSDMLTIGEMTRPDHGTITKDGKSIVYQHDGGSAASDSFTYKALISEEDLLYEDEATVSITIQQGESPVNQAPTAEAGANKTVQVNESVIITGSGSDDGGSIVSYEWKKGEDVLARTAEFTYTPTVAGVDTLKLTVTDNDGASASDEMNVTVTAAAAESHKPVATDKNDASMPADCNISDPGSTFTLEGSDEDGDTLAFYKVTDPIYGEVTISESSGKAVFKLRNSDDQGKCLDGMDNNFTFKVNDGEADSEPATVTLNPPTSE